MAALIVSNGGTLYDVQAQLGHASSVSSQRYAHLHASRLKHTSQRIANCIEEAIVVPRRADSEHLEGTDKQEEMPSMPTLLTRGNESVTSTASTGYMM